MAVKQHPQLCRSGLADLALILLAALLVHGLLLLNDGLYWDEWVFLGPHREFFAARTAWLLAQNGRLPTACLSSGR